MRLLSADKEALEQLKQTNNNKKEWVVSFLWVFKEDRQSVWNLEKGKYRVCL